MQKHFIYAWLFYWALVGILPVKSIYPLTEYALLLQLAFVTLVLLSFNLVSLISPNRVMDRRASLPRVLLLIKISLWLSLLGAIFLIYDKVFIQHIDYSDGIAKAREQWREIGEDRGNSASSIFSVLGYLTGSAYYVAAVLAFTEIDQLTRRQRVWVLSACLIFVFANSIITGGRSNILLIAGFILGSISLGGTTTISGFFSGLRQKLVMSLGFLLVAAYLLFVFQQRAAAGEMSVLEYTFDFLPFLGLRPDEWYAEGLSNGSANAVVASIVLAITYVTHSFSTTAAILSSPTTDATIIFNHLFGLLSKVGLAGEVTTDWSLSGRFPSVPGALFHQFGAVGFAIGGLVLGAVCGLISLWAKRTPVRLLPTLLFAMAYTCLIFTPLLFAGDFLSFPFVVLSALLIMSIDILLRLRMTRQRSPSEPPAYEHRDIA